MKILVPLFALFLLALPLSADEDQPKDEKRPEKGASEAVDPEKAQRQQELKEIGKVLDPDSEIEKKQDKEIHEQMMILHHFLQMPPEKLSTIREAIERLEAMTPEEKEDLRKRIDHYLANRPRMERDRSPREGPDRSEWRLWRHYWWHLSAEEQAAAKKRFDEMSHEERVAEFNRIVAETRVRIEKGELEPLPERDRRDDRRRDDRRRGEDRGEERDRRDEDRRDEDERSSEGGDEQAFGDREAEDGQAHKCEDCESSCDGSKA